MLIKILLYWLPMIVLAFANASLREFVLVKYYSVQRSQQLSTLSLILLCSIYLWYTIPLMNLQTTMEAMIAGFSWMVLTILFEFAMGLITHKSWPVMVENYNISKGKLWPLFLLSLLFMPLIILILRNPK